MFNWGTVLRLCPKAVRVSLCCQQANAEPEVMAFDPPTPSPVKPSAAAAQPKPARPTAAQPAAAQRGEWDGTFATVGQPNGPAIPAANEMGSGRKLCVPYALLLACTCARMRTLACDDGRFGCVIGGGRGDAVGTVEAVAAGHTDAVAAGEPADDTGAVWPCEQQRSAAQRSEVEWIEEWTGWNKRPICTSERRTRRTRGHGVRAANTESSQASSSGRCSGSGAKPDGSKATVCRAAGRRMGL